MNNYIKIKIKDKQLPQTDTKFISAQRFSEKFYEEPNNRQRKSEQYISL